MHYQRTVVKVGTSSLTHETGMLHLEHMDKLVRTLADLIGAGREIILVSSGAIGAGVSRAGLAKRPSLLRERQAAAAVGQCSLMHVYDKLSSEYGRPVAQILLTAHDLSDDIRREHLCHTLETLLDWGVLPIINANDSVSAEETELHGEKLFGDNDKLSALVAATVKADLLVLLTDTEGLYDADPRSNPNAQLIKRVTAVTPELREGCGGAGTSRGTGGMLSKLDAAQYALECGIDMAITNGAYPGALYDLIYKRNQVGTLFTADKQPV